MTRRAASLERFARAWLLLSAGCTGGVEIGANGWREEVRSSVRSVLEPFDARATSVEPVIVSSTLRPLDAILAEDLRYTTDDGVVVSLVRLTPARGPERLPAVLVVHGHSSSSDDLVQDTGTYCRGLALELARRGFVTLSPDLRSFGRSTTTRAGHTEYAKEVRASDDVYARLAANDLRVALSILRRSPRVDPERVGVAGISLGGFLAFMLALAEPDVDAVVISGIFVPFDVIFDHHCSCERIVELGDIGAAHELAAALPPQAVQIHWGALDRTFAIEDGGLANTASLLELAEELGTPPSIEVHVSPGVRHAFDPPAQIEFLRRALGGGAEAPD